METQFCQEKNTASYKSLNPGRDNGHEETQAVTVAGQGEVGQGEGQGTEGQGDRGTEGDDW